jgi:hypothetical protein
MKIVLHDLDGVLDDITLGNDDAEDFVIDPPPLPDSGREPQIDRGAFADRQFAVSRYNRLTEFVWKVARTHDSIDDAWAFMQGHDALVPNNASMTVNGQEAYSSLVIARVKAVEWVGIATVFEYHVTGAVPVPVQTDS